MRRDFNRQTPAPHHTRIIIQNGNLSSDHGDTVPPVHSAMHRLREHQPRQLILQQVTHPQKRPIVLPFKIWLCDGPIAAVCNDRFHNLVLGSVADSQKVHGFDQGWIVPELRED